MVSLASGEAVVPSRETAMKAVGALESVGRGGALCLWYFVDFFICVCVFGFSLSVWLFYLRGQTEHGNHEWECRITRFPCRRTVGPVGGLAIACVDACVNFWFFI